jgi:DNA-binding response OmpR family regulator
VAINVRRAGGHVLIERGATPGTAVGICLPAKDSISSSQGVRASTPAVLVVDGDAWLRTTTAHLLRRGGYGVLQADHASAALEVLRGVTGSCVRVMLIDTDLPGNEAPALVRDARKLRSDLQVVHVGRARAGSRDDLLTKPFTAAELLQAIGRRLGPAIAR